MPAEVFGRRSLATARKKQRDSDSQRQSETDITREKDMYDIAQKSVLEVRKDMRYACALTIYIFSMTEAFCAVL